MIRIRKVNIQNFQSHENTTLEFDNGLNVIIGPSDQGKSAILRAIKWVLYNEPRGTEFIRQGTTSARVAVEFSNGNTVIRERSKSKNRYTVIDSEGQETVYEGFVNEVPEEVVKAHGIPKVALDTDLHSLLNISDQLEGPFLLSETPSTRAKAIGRLTGLHIIDRALRDTIVDHRREGQTAERLRGELNEVGERLEQYKILERMEERVSTLGGTLAELEELLVRKTKLEDLLQKVNQLEEEQALLEERLKRLDKLPECELLIKNCEVGKSKLDLLIHFDGTYTALTEELRKNTECLFATRHLSTVSEYADTAAGKVMRLERLNTAMRQYSALTSEMEKQERILAATSNFPVLELIYKRLSDRISQYAVFYQSAEKAGRLNRDLKQTGAVLAQSRKTLECEATMETLQKKILVLEKLEDLQVQYKTIGHNILEGRKFLESNKREIAGHTVKYTKLLKTIGKCPLCNSDISEAKISEIVKHYEEDHA